MNDTAWPVPARVVLLLLAAAGAGCVTASECEARVDDAVALGELHGTDCAWDPDALAETTCGGSDRRPELSYYAAFCSAADIETCLMPDETLLEACFGQP